MGNLDFSANADQLKELAAYMASQINVPTIGIGGGYAPLGTINFFDATVAPQDWLACDGSVYNIADYPQLAEWYATQHGASNFYGGNGTTTFAVPDLQGEFLRGTGTNSHTNQGSGAALGVHQDGTITSSLTSNSTNANRIAIWTDAAYMDAPNLIGTTLKADSVISGSINVSSPITSNSSGASQIAHTSRPTNTSFLICVKAVVAGEVYSTDERVVGTWIDGKPVYQRTWELSSELVMDGNTWYESPLPKSEVSFVISAFGVSYSEGGCIPLMTIKHGSYSNIAVMHNRASIGMTMKYLTIQYTKTTD